MATYNDKKKLIEDNSDLYISDYDKNLDYSYLSDIIDQKRFYTKAESVGDTEGMKKANDRANAVRMQAASYVAGEDGSAYNRVKRPYEEGVPNKPSDKYKSEKERVYNLISAYKDFKYDVYSDPLYKVYKDIYLSLGDDAYERTLGEESMRTGGISSTSAISAAMAAKNKYNTMLANMVPELYDKAYSKHKDGLEDLYGRLEAVGEMDDTEYEHYRDDVDDYSDNRDYYYRKDEDISDDLYETYTDETDREYDESRDSVEDKQKEDELGYKIYKVDSEIDYKEGRDDKEYAYNRERDDKEFAYKRERDLDDFDMKKLSVAVNLARALYGGKVPVPRNAVTTILSMLE